MSDNTVIVRGSRTLKLREQAKTVKILPSATQFKGKEPNQIVLKAMPQNFVGKSYKWYRDGGTTIVDTAQQITIRNSAVDTVATFRVVCTSDDDKTYEDTISISKVENGEKGDVGKRGQMPIQREWKVGEVYRNNDEVIDYIYHRPSNSWWRLKDGITEATAKLDPDNNFVRMTSLEQLAVNLLIAEEANLGGLIFKDGRLVSQYPSTTNPNLIIDGINGKIIIKDGEFTGRVTIGEGSPAFDQIQGIVDEVEVGTRNLLLKSNLGRKETNSYNTHNFYLSTPDEMENDKDYTFTVWGKLGEGKTHFGIWNSGGSVSLATLKMVEEGKYQANFKWRNKNGVHSVNNQFVSLYAVPNSVTSVNTILRAKLEKGNKASDWTPAPEDNDISNIQIGATNLLNIDNFEQGTISEGSAIGTTYPNFKLNSSSYNDIRIRTKELIPINGSCVISIENTDFKYFAFEFDENQKYLGVSKYISATQETTFKENVKYIGIGVLRSDNKQITPIDIVNAKVQLEIGNMKTSWGMSPLDTNYLIEDIKIGTRNLITIDLLKRNKTFRAMASYNGYYVNMSLQQGYTGGGLGINTENGTKRIFATNKDIIFKPKTKYILSVDGVITSNNTGKYSLGNFEFFYTDKTTDVKQIQYGEVGSDFSLLLESNPNKTIQSIDMTYGGNGTYDVNIQLEEGNKKSQWKPAYEDTNQNIVDSIDNIQVGVRNLLLKSKSTEYLVWNSTNGTIQKNEVSVKATCTKAVEAYGIKNPLESTFDKDDDLVLSFRVRGNIKELNYVYILRGDISNNQQLPTIDLSNINTTNYTTVSIKIKISEATKMGGVLIGSRTINKVGDWFEIEKGVMITRGNKIPTDWTPAPEDIENKVDNININSENLIYNSNKFLSGTRSAGLTSSITENKTLLVKSTAGNSNWFTNFFDYKMTVPSSNIINFDRTALKNGETLLFSYECKVISGTDVPTFYMANSGYYNVINKGELIKGEFVRYYGFVTLRDPMNNTTPHIHLGFKDVVGEYEFRNFKVERGNKPTGWSPAPQDYNYQINDLIIGSRNYLMNSTNIKLTGSDRPTTNNISNRQDDGSFRITSTGTGGIMSRYNWLQSPNNDPIYNYVTDKDFVKGGYKLMLSMKVRSNSEYYFVRLNIRDPHGNSPHVYVPKTNEFVRIEIPLVVERNEARTLMLLLFSSNTQVPKDHWVEYKELKLELGDKSTDWIPAPEDSDSLQAGGRNYFRMSTLNLHTPYQTLVSKVGLNKFTLKATGTNSYLVFSCTPNDYIKERAILSGYILINGKPITRFLSGIQTYRATESFEVKQDGYFIGILSKHTSESTWMIHGQPVKSDGSTLVKDDIIEIINFKYELSDIGNKPTGWSPAHEDLEAQIKDQEIFVEYSLNGTSNWHFPFQSTDRFMRQKKGDGAWSGAMPFGKDGTNGTNGTNGKDGKYTLMQFAKNTSLTSPPTSGWQSTPPTTSKAEYVWYRTGEVIPPATSPTSWSNATRISGENGEKGDKGDKGETGENGISLSEGKMLRRDPTFKKGWNGMGIYNNGGSGNVTVARIPKTSDVPTDSTHIMQYKNVGTASPSLGGWSLITNSKANGHFIRKIIAKIPKGYTINNNQNAVGNGSKHSWLTSREGTGKYETYIYRLECGDTGSFSSFGYISISGSPQGTPSAPVTVDICYDTMFDMTIADPTADDAWELSQAQQQELNATKDTLNILTGKTNYMITDIQGNVVTTGTLEVGSTTGSGATLKSTAKAGLTGMASTNATNIQQNRRVVFYAGTGFANRESANVQIWDDGYVVMQNAYVKGKIDATSGTFTNITANNLTVNSGKFLGTIEAEQGRMGALEIFNNGLIYSYSSQIAQKYSERYVINLFFKDNSQAGIGANLIDASSDGGISWSTGRLFCNYIRQDDDFGLENMKTRNIGLQVSASGAKRNHAIMIHKGDISGLALHTRYHKYWGDAYDMTNESVLIVLAGNNYTSSIGLPSGNNRWDGRTITIMMKGNGSMDIYPNTSALYLHESHYCGAGQKLHFGRWATRMTMTYLQETNCWYITSINEY